MSEVDTVVIDKKAVMILEEANTLTISNGEQYEMAGGILEVIKDLGKEIADTFSPVISAALTAHRAALVAKRKHTDPLDRAEQIIKSRRSKFRIEQNRIREEELKRIQIQAKKDEKKGIVRPQPLPVTESPKAMGKYEKMNWKFEITNAKLIPREYLKVDEVKIGKVVRALKGETRIKGIRAYEEQ